MSSTTLLFEICNQNKTQMRLTATLSEWCCSQLMPKTISGISGRWGSLLANYFLQIWKQMLSSIKLNRTVIPNNKNIVYSHFCYAMQLKQPQNLHNMQYINASTKI